MSPFPSDNVILLGETNFRNHRVRFGIKRADRRHHVYIIGKTGTGKSTLIANLARQDLANGEGFALLDPHGDLVEHVRTLVPSERAADLIYFNPADPAHTLAFNRLRLLTVQGGIWSPPGSLVCSGRYGAPNGPMAYGADAGATEVLPGRCWRQARSESEQDHQETVRSLTHFSPIHEVGEGIGAYQFLQPDGVTWRASGFGDRGRSDVHVFSEFPGIILCCACHYARNR